MMRGFQAITTAAVVYIALNCSTLMAQTDVISSQSSSRPRTEAEYITKQLHGDDENVKAALDRINVLVEAGVQVSPNWLSALAEKGLYKDAESVASKGILNVAENPGGVAALQRFRVTALLEEGKRDDDALAAAKAYYNVSMLKDTETAVKLMAQCLDAIHPDDPSLLKRFKTQQVEWSTATTNPSQSAELGDNVLLSIKIPEEPFVSAAAGLTRRDFSSFIAKGNLLLLCDHAAEARKAFESAELAAEKPEQTKAAVEGIARSIRAKAGALGPANAYIMAQQKGQ